MENSRCFVQFKFFFFTVSVVEPDIVEIFWCSELHKNSVLTMFTLLKRLIVILFHTQIDEHCKSVNYGFNKKQSGSQSRLCMCSWFAASDSSRRFCSVTAVVCRLCGHMTWGTLPPSSQCLLFLGKMAAIVLLLHMTYMNSCEPTKLGKAGDPFILQWNRPRLLEHVLHIDGTVNVNSFNRFF